MITIVKINVTKSFLKTRGHFTCYAAEVEDVLNNPPARCEYYHIVIGLRNCRHRVLITPDDYSFGRTSLVRTTLV